MAPSLGEVHQTFVTTHRELVTIHDFVFDEGRLNSQYGVIPQNIWTFVRDQGEQGKSLIRQWYRNNQELIDHILESDPTANRTREILDSLSTSAQALISSVHELVKRTNEPVRG